MFNGHNCAGFSSAASVIWFSCTKIGWSSCNSSSSWSPSSYLTWINYKFEVVLTAYQHKHNKSSNTSFFLLQIYDTDSAYPMPNEDRKTLNFTLFTQMPLFFVINLDALGQPPLTQYMCCLSNYMGKPLFRFVIWAFKWSIHPLCLSFRGWPMAIDKIMDICEGI